MINYITSEHNYMINYITSQLNHNYMINYITSQHNYMIKLSFISFTNALSGQGMPDAIKHSPNSPSAATPLSTLVCV
jgi:hypothetical protein